MPEVIKINTNPIIPKLKIGDIVQIDNMKPVKAVQWFGCGECAYMDRDYEDCRLWCNNKNIMFAEVKDGKAE